MSRATIPLPLCLRRVLGLVFVLFLLGALGAGAAEAQDFRKRTFQAGLGSAISTTGVAVADFNRSGHLDLYVVVKASTDPSNPATWSRLFRNRGDATFAVVTPAQVLAGADSSTTNSIGYAYKVGASWGDFDNDGYPDLFLTHAGPDQLLRNNGDGTFTDITAQTGMRGGQTQFSSSALWFDYDLDGHLDLYVSVWEDYTQGPRNLDNRLYRNLGNGQFEDVTQASGMADGGMTWMAIALDVSGNGYPDLYLANDYGPNRFYVNNGDGTFTEATAQYGLEDEYHGMGLAIADVTGNGHFDIYLTNISTGEDPDEINRLFLNTGEGYFVDVATEAGVSHALWGWGTEFIDATNQGSEDLVVVAGKYYPTMANSFFRNLSADGNLVFENVAEELGLDELAAGRGIAAFDYDGDGDLDLVYSNFTDSIGLYENRVATGNWLQIKLEGTLSNRDGFGAVVEIEAGGRSQRRLHHGAQFLGQNITPVHFGLSDADLVETVTVRWPSGEIDVVHGVAANQRILIREAEGLVRNETSSPASSDGLRALGNHPNPFSTHTAIRFTLASPNEVSLTVYDLLGRPVHTTRNVIAQAGEHTITWQPSAELAAGVYVYRLSTSTGESDRGRLLVIR